MSTRIIQNGAPVASRRIELRHTLRRLNSILLAGTGKAAAAAAQRLVAAHGRAVLCGVVDSKLQRELREAFPEVPWLGSFDGLAECMARHCVDELHIALPLKSFAQHIGDLQVAANAVGARVVVHIDLAPWMPAGEPSISGDALVIESPVH